jgi:glycosyltransferase involved in cell wall biosynthesis
MKLSIIIPNYNKVDKLKRLLDSIIALSLDDYEIIIVDDGSNAETRQFLSTLTQYKVLLKPNIGGPAEGRELGYKISKGDFIYFCDNDDELLPDFKLCVEEAISLNMPIYQFSSLYCHENGTESFKKHKESKQVSISELEKEYGWNLIWTHIYRRDVLEDIKFVFYGPGEDRLVCLQIYEKFPTVFVTDKVGYKHYFGDETHLARKIYMDKNKMVQLRRNKQLFKEIVPNPKLDLTKRIFSKETSR